MSRSLRTRCRIRRVRCVSEQENTQLRLEMPYGAADLKQHFMPPQKPDWRELAYTASPSPRRGVLCNVVSAKMGLVTRGGCQILRILNHLLLGTINLTGFQILTQPCSLRSLQRYERKGLRCLLNGGLKSILPSRCGAVPVSGDVAHTGRCPLQSLSQSWLSVSTVLFMG
jgi:hypothetical protein